MRMKQVNVCKLLKEKPLGFFPLFGNSSYSVPPQRNALLRENQKGEIP
ncbi:hypothetical protein H206_05354 [Candidatus Electrothrix aarhusensis]|uniref:Uncharacterized protein n=1 Tax=Candidatus Electrothrix aarhusensis TaxID=1859131 RepID=A0A3S3SQY3_9BACT|nr:hypothetical protein H206_05354 [Candidatus Electrothrix aarhusensis]